MHAGIQSNVIRTGSAGAPIAVNVRRGRETRHKPVALSVLYAVYYRFINQDYSSIRSHKLRASFAR